MEKARLWNRRFQTQYLLFQNEFEIEEFWYSNCVVMLDKIVWNRCFNRCANKWLIFNWIVSDIKQYLEQSDFVNQTE